MQGIFGALHWSPDQFWRATLTEISAALDGHNLLQGREHPMDGPDDKEMAELLRKYG